MELSTFGRSTLGPFARSRRPSPLRLWRAFWAVERQGGWKVNDWVGPVIPRVWARTFWNGSLWHYDAILPLFPRVFVAKTGRVLLVLWPDRG